MSSDDKEFKKYSQFLKVLKNRQSYRVFDKREVPDKYIPLLIDAARQAPSSCNHQLTRYVVIQDPDLQQQIAKEIPGQEIVRNAPLTIIPIIRLGWNHNKYSIIQSLGMAEQNILGAATSLGLRSIVRAGIGDTQKWKDILEIPEGYEMYSAISVGYCEEDFPRAPKIPVEKLYSIDKFSEEHSLAYPRKEVKVTYQSYSNNKSPDAVWDPDKWTLEQIKTWREYALWHRSPTEGSHRSRRLAPEFKTEVEWVQTHVTKNAKVLEVLPFTAAFGAKLREISPKFQWCVFELSEHHEEFINKRCEKEDVRPPEEFYSHQNWGVDLGQQFDIILLPQSLNHVSFSPNLIEFLDRHLNQEGKLLLIMRNAFSLYYLQYLYLKKGQVWNFGPYKPRSKKKAYAFLEQKFLLEKNLGVSLMPPVLGDVHQGLLNNFCRTLLSTWTKK